MGIGEGKERIEGPLEVTGAIELSGSNVEGTPGAAIPSKAVLIGGSNSSGTLVLPRVTAIDDGETAGNGLVNAARTQGYNGSTWDRWRNNMQGTLLVSAARAANTNSPVQTNYNARGVLIILDITVASGTGGIKVVIRTTDPVSGKPLNLVADPIAITSTGTYGYCVYPGDNAADGAAQLLIQKHTPVPLPRTFYVTVVHGDASGYTYSVGYALIL